MSVISQVSFAITPIERLTASELNVLAHLDQAALTAPVRAHVELHVTDAPPAGIDLASAPTGLEADVTYSNGWLQLRHADFAMTLETPGTCGHVYRAEQSGFSLYFCIRNAWLCAAAGSGTVPLHSASLLMGEQAVAFFGVSGAGKTTLSSRSPFTVISDELNAIEPDHSGRWTLRSSGFWGRESRLERRGPVDRFPLAAVVLLQKGETFEMAPLSAPDAMRAILSSIMLPPVPHLWRSLMSNLNQLLAAVPTYRMAWSLDEEPWDGIRQTTGL